MPERDAMPHSRDEAPTQDGHRLESSWIPNVKGGLLVWSVLSRVICWLGLFQFVQGMECTKLLAEHLPLQTQFKEKGASCLQSSNGLNSRFDYEDENTVQEDGSQQMYPLYNQMCYQDPSPHKHHSNNPERPYIHPREHYV